MTLYPVEFHKAHHSVSASNDGCPLSDSLQENHGLKTVSLKTVSWWRLTVGSHHWQVRFQSASEIEPGPSLCRCSCGPTIHMPILSVPSLANVNWPSHGVYLIGHCLFVMGAFGSEVCSHVSQKSSHIVPTPFRLSIFLCAKLLSNFSVLYLPDPSF